MMFASALGVFVAMGLFIFLSIFYLIGLAGSLGSSSVYMPKSNTVFKISLDGSITDSDINNPFSGLLSSEEGPVSLQSLLESIEKAKNNDNIKGIYLEAGMLSTGTANRQAIRRALLDFKESGKFIVAYGDIMTQGNLYICSVADKIFVNPKGAVEVSGMVSQTMFYKGLMEKIGVDLEIFKVGTYKGAVEPFMLDKLSDANREQIDSYINSIWNNITNGIAESRGITAESINAFSNEGLSFSDPVKAIEYGLVDDLKYKEEADTYVKELAGQSGKELKTTSIDKIKNIKTAKKEKGGQIAILYAEGEIRKSTPASAWESQNYISEKMVKELIKLKNDDNVKAVVLRVNSPGGSAYISEQIWHQVEEIKKEKPIVVSMGSLAASGGYYISCAANKIVAEPTTLTGSIGIFGILPNTTGTFKKIGVTSDVVKTNKYADIGNMARPMQEDEKVLIQQNVERGYDLFITRCADGRGMTKEQIDAIGQGRVWTGEQAIEKGLVDQLGGIETAIQTAADLAELTEYYTVDISGSKDFFTELLEKQLNDIKFSILHDVLGEDLEYIKTLNTIRSVSGVQARLPYDMKAL